MYASALVSRKSCLHLLIMNHLHSSKTSPFVIAVCGLFLVAAGSTLAGQTKSSMKAGESTKKNRSNKAEKNIELTPFQPVLKLPISPALPGDDDSTTLSLSHFLEEPNPSPGQSSRVEKALHSPGHLSQGASVDIVQAEKKPNVQLHHELAPLANPPSAMMDAASADVVDRVMGRRVAPAEPTAVPAPVMERHAATPAPVTLQTGALQVVPVNILDEPDGFWPEVPAQWLALIAGNESPSAAAAKTPPLTPLPVENPPVAPLPAETLPVVSPTIAHQPVAPMPLPSPAVLCVLAIDLPASLVPTVASPAAPAPVAAPPIAESALPPVVELAAAAPPVVLLPAVAQPLAPASPTMSPVVKPVVAAQPVESVPPPAPDLPRLPVVAPLLASVAATLPEVAAAAPPISPTSVLLQSPAQPVVQRVAVAPMVAPLPAVSAPPAAAPAPIPSIKPVPVAAQHVAQPAVATPHATPLPLVVQVVMPVVTATSSPQQPPVIAQPVARMAAAIPAAAPLPVATRPAAPSPVLVQAVVPTAAPSRPPSPMAAQPAAHTPATPPAAPLPVVTQPLAPVAASTPALQPLPAAAPPVARVTVASPAVTPLPVFTPSVARPSTPGPSTAALPMANQPVARMSTPGAPVAPACAAVQLVAPVPMEPQPAVIRPTAAELQAVRLKPLRAQPRPAIEAAAVVPLADPADPADPVEPAALAPAAQETPAHHPAAAREVDKAAETDKEDVPAAAAQAVDSGIVDQALPPPGQSAQPSYRAEMSLVSALPAQLLQSDLAMLGDLHKRMGDDDGTAGNERRAWGRMLRADASMRQAGTVAPQTTGHLNGFQVGHDLHADQSFKVGLYVGQLEGHMRVDGIVRGTERGRAGCNRLQNRYLGAYGTWQDAAGPYVDTVLQRAAYRSQMHTDDNRHATVKGDGWLASLEVGKAHAINSQWHMEPQAQIIYRRVTLDDTLLDQAQVMHQTQGGWTLRLGMRIKARLTTTVGVLQPYGRFNVYRGNRSVDTARFITSGTSTEIRSHGARNTSELATGGTLQLDPLTSLYCELGQRRAHGADARMKGAVQASAGLKRYW